MIFIYSKRLYSLKTSKLYSFQSKCVFLPYLSVTMHFVPAWGNFILWLLCHSLLYLNGFHNGTF